jgi:hypothetical protein
MSTDLFSLLSLLLFVGCAYLAYLNLILPDRGSACGAYMWISAPGVLICSFYAFRYLANGGPFPILFIMVVSVYGVLNPGSWIFPIVLFCNAVARPRPSNEKTWIGCFVLGGLWVWSFVFDNFVLPKMLDAF